MEIQIIEPKPGRVLVVNFTSEEELARSQGQIEHLRGFLEKHDMTLCVVRGGALVGAATENHDAEIIAEARKVAREFGRYIDTQRSLHLEYLKYGIDSYYGKCLQRLIDACQPLGEDTHA